MNFIDIAGIVTPPNRQRRKFDEGELAELRESIQARGLLHAIVLREGKTLVAGERRIRAIKDLHDLGGSFTYGGQVVPTGFIPFNDLGELSPLEAMEAEYEENVRRADLDWKERAAATAALASLRTVQAQMKGKNAPTVAEIAVEVRGSDSGSNHDYTKMEIILAGHLHDPDVAAAKSVEEGFKVLKRKEAARRHEELGELVGRTFSAADHRLINGDCREAMTEMESGYFDVILTDPPYGMGADEFGDSGGKANAHGYEDTPQGLYAILTWLPQELFRLAKPEAHAYVFCDIDFFHGMKDCFDAAGWKVFRTPLIWFKPSAYRAPWPEQGPQRKYECILYAVKGEKKVTKLAGDVLEYSPDENLGHAAQKPVDLFVDLLTRSVTPGAKILDPFAGSGTIFPAAHRLKCSATGIEKDTGAYGIAAGRLKELK